jgi:hypothetical protein
LFFLYSFLTTFCHFLQRRRKNVLLIISNIFS